MDPNSGESRRDAVVSAANLLMVALLKLNRVLVPALLRWMRSARLEWVRRSSQDIADQLSNGTAPTRPCVGSCCRGLSSDTTPLLQRPSPTQMEAAAAASADAEEDDRRFRLLVAQEERHRGNRMVLFAYTSVMSVYFTVATLLLYSGLIIGLVLWLFPFDDWAALVFSFSLVATATISESETLMGSRRKATAARAKAAGAAARVVTPGEQLGRVGVAGPADAGDGMAGVGNKNGPGSGEMVADGQMGTQGGAGAGAVAIAVEEVEDFSDLEK